MEGRLLGSSLPLLHGQQAGDGCLSASPPLPQHIIRFAADAGLEVPGSARRARRGHRLFE